MNVDLIREIITTSVMSSIFSTTLIQKFKEYKIPKYILYLLSFVLSIGIGILFSLSFTNLNFINSIWVGFTTWIGADVIYKSLEDKLFSSYKNIENIVEIRRDDDNG